MASSLRSSGTISFMKCMLLYVAHTNAKPTYSTRIMNGQYPPIIRFRIAARVRGNRQYPNKQILWKKLIVPPKSYPFKAITAPPSHTITKTSSKRRVLSSACVPDESTLNEEGGK